MPNLVTMRRAGSPLPYANRLVVCALISVILGAYAPRSSLVKLTTDCTILSPSPAVGASKIALIVAIGTYDQKTNWSNTSAENDVSLMKAALAAQGFDTVSHVAVLRNQQATRAGIVRAIRRHLLGKAQPGSVAVLHYSGHGQQVFDDNGDELDGYDEALVPYDAPQQVNQAFLNYHGEKHLRDDELGELLRQVRQKIGPAGDLIVVLDACHSGTATRGAITHSRGTPLKIAPEGYEPTSRGGVSQTETWGEAGSETQLSPMVVISGSGANQLNYETLDKSGRRVGSLSYALSGLLGTAAVGTSYRGLFDHLAVKMSALSPRQSPQIEGSIDRRILGGQGVPPVDHYSVIKHHGDQHISISGGQLHGIFQDTEVALYDIDTQDTTGVLPIATGRVVTSFLQESDVRLDRGVSRREADRAWVFLKSRNFGSLRVGVKLDIRDNEEFTEALGQKFAEVPLIDATSSAPALLVEMNTAYTQNQGADFLRIVTAQDYVYYQTEVLAAEILETAEAVTRQIVSYAQASFLRHLTMSNKDIWVSFEVIPIEVEQLGRRFVEKVRIPPEDKLDDDGILVLTEGDYIKLRIINRGAKKAYFTLLDIQPDNVINALIPGVGIPAEEYFVAPGDTVVPADIFRISRPFGTEIFKLIATPEPVQLGSLVTTRGEPGRKQSPLEKLLNHTYTNSRGQVRGAGTPNVPPTAGHIETFIFRIAPAK